MLYHPARVRSPLINTGLLIGSLVLFFGGIEIGLRITGIVSVRPQPPQIYQRNANPHISYELKPNLKEKTFRTTVTTDEFGLRSHGVASNPNAPIVAVLGDSITFGYGVEDDETLPARLQELLPQYQFLNAGMPGYEIEQEAALYQTKIAPLNPSVLILVFYFNDLNWHKPAVLDDQGNLRPPDWIPENDPVCDPIEEGILGILPAKCWLDQHSAFYVAVKKFVTMRQGQKDLREQREEARKPGAEDPITQEQLDRYEEELRRFASSLDELPRLFVIWPDKLLHSESRPKIIEIAKQNGFEVRDLYELFGNEARTLSWDTVHPHPQTIMEAAEFLRNKVEELTATR